jgi:hypothetical protein
MELYGEANPVPSGFGRWDAGSVRNPWHVDFHKGIELT